MNVEVLFENADFLAVNKPAGLLVHGIFDKYGPKHSEKTLVDWILENYPEIKNVGDMPVHNSEAGEFPFRPGIVHRLDRETSGVLLIAKNQKSFEYLKGLFQGKQVVKNYEALVWGRLKEKQGVIDKPISIRNGSVKRTVFKGKAPREAVTEYELLSVYEDEHGSEFSLVLAKPKTGRTHQIRVHFASIGHPLVGDKLYGKRGSIAGLERHFLHAKSLEFDNYKIEAPLADDLEKVLNTLEKTGDSVENY
ncbi:MAG: RNA pseudouridine synthase [bacterium]|nr:RNA pseudouridine synthase [bacterium]